MTDKELKEMARLFWEKLKEIQDAVGYIKCEACCFCEERKIDEILARLESIEQKLKEKRNHE